MADESQPCWVYRSPHKPEMYLYLAAPDGFDVIPEALLDQFGEPVLVIELELSPDRRLAREDVEIVMCNLRTRGYHLQLPPRLRPAVYHQPAD